LMKEPRQSQGGGVFAELVGHALVLAGGVEVANQPGLGRLAGTPTFPLLAQDATEQTAGEGRPRDHTEAIGARGGEDLELNRTVEQVVQRLLTDQSHEVAGPGRLLRLRQVPPGEVRRTRVDD